MGANVRAVDRVIPQAIGGYPINYGFVPQTVSYDGDPFDALVLGPPLPGGSIVSGIIVGLMFMEDEKGLDSKVVLSPIDRMGVLFINSPTRIARRPPNTSANTSAMSAGSSRGYRGGALWLKGAPLS